MAKLVTELVTQQAERAANSLSRKLDKLTGRAAAMDSAFAKGDTSSRRFGAGLNSLYSVTTLVHAAIVGMVGYLTGKLVRSFIAASSTVEQLQVRLQVLLGSVDEGNALFRDMAQYAGTVPFEFENIMEAATRLSGVLKGGRKDIDAWIPIIGDLAATTGLSIDQTTDQVIRMLSAGAGAADLFRERGVLAMLGFTSGVSYSAKQSAQILVEEWSKADSKFRGATNKLADTWTGQVSMMKDAWFKFRVAVMDQGAYDSMKKFASLFVELMQDKSVQELAVNIGKGIASIATSLAHGAQNWRTYYAAILDVASGILSTLSKAVSKINGFLRMVAELQYNVASIPLVGSQQRALNQFYAGITKAFDNADKAAAGLMQTSQSLAEKSDAAIRRQVELDTQFGKNTSAAGDYNSNLKTLLDSLDGLSDKSGKAKKGLEEVYNAMAASNGGLFGGFTTDALGRVQAPTAGMFGTSGGFGLNPIKQAIDQVVLSTQAQIIEQRNQIDDTYRAFKTKQAESMDRFAKLGEQILSDMATTFIQSGKAGWDDLLSSLRSGFASMIDSLIQKLSTSSSGGANLFGKFLGGIGAAIGVVQLASSLRASKARSHETSLASAGYFGGRFQALGQGPQAAEAQQAADAIQSLLSSIRDSTGALIDGIGRIEVQFNEHKRQYEAVGVGMFSTMNEAIMAGIKHAIESGGVLNQLDPLMQSVLKNAQFHDPASAQKAIETTQSILDAASGLSDLALNMEKFQGTLASLEDQLTSAGVAAGDAAQLVGQFAVNQLNSWRDQITGRQKSNAELLQEKQQEAKLFNAQVELTRAKLEAEKATLSGQIALAKGERSITDARLAINRKWLLDEKEIFRADTQLKQTQLKVSGSYVNTQISLINKQIAAIDKVIASLPKEIKMSEIHLPNLARNIGKVGNAAKDAASQLDSALQSLLDYRRSLNVNEFGAMAQSPERLLFSARSQFNSLLSGARGGDVTSINNLQGASTSLLDIARQMFGSGAGFQTIYRQVTSSLDQVLGAHGLSAAISPAEKTAANTLQLVTSQNQTTSAVKATQKAIEDSAEQTAKAIDSNTSTAKKIALTNEEYTKVTNSKLDTISSQMGTLIKKYDELKRTRVV